jgi:hypothetical protein
VIDTSLLTAADLNRLPTGLAAAAHLEREPSRQSGLCVEVAHHDLPPRAGPASALPDNTAGEIG